MTEGVEQAFLSDSVLESGIPDTGVVTLCCFSTSAKSSYKLSSMVAIISDHESERELTGLDASLKGGISPEEALAAS